MSMYNMMFGQSGNSNFLLELLGLSEGDFYRFRDCYLTEEGEIAVYTRAGGGNRECDCRDYKDTEEYGSVVIDDYEHDGVCVVVKNHSILKHPLYLRDEDDDFDRTYATYYFRIPEEVDQEELAKIKPEISRSDAWLVFLDKLKGSNDDR